MANDYPLNRRGFLRGAVVAGMGLAISSTGSTLSSMAQPTPSNVKPMEELFADDGAITNSKLPLLLYRQALTADGQDAGTTERLADAIEKRFASNNWTGSWRAAVYTFHHYHSLSHEVLGVYRGSATLQLGGEKGRKFEVKPGDIIVIPAGVGHKRLESSADFNVVGAYRNGRRWDLLRGNPGERPQADQNIAAVPLPEGDPLYGKTGPLMKIWSEAVGKKAS